MPRRSQKLVGINGSHAAWHYDGSSWSADTLALPVAADPHLSRISCPTSSSCMAIGTYAHGARRRPYALVWNGTTWSPPANPLPFVDDDLVGVLDQDLTCLRHSTKSWQLLRSFRSTIWMTFRPGLSIS